MSAQTKNVTSLASTPKRMAPAKVPSNIPFTLEQELTAFVEI